MSRATASSGSPLTVGFNRRSGGRPKKGQLRRSVVRRDKYPLEAVKVVFFTYVLVIIAGLAVAITVGLINR